MTPIDIRRVGAEGRDFDRLGMIVGHDPDHAEFRTDCDCVVEHFLHDLGPRVGGDVVIFGLHAEHAISHASASEVRAKSRVRQAMRDFQRLFFPVDHWRIPRIIL